MPGYLKYLLNLVLPERDRDYLLGDYEFIYNDLCDRRGRLKALAWLWAHLFKTAPKFIINSIYWGVMMFRNYIKIAFRNFLKRKTHAAINLIGLSIGIAAVIFILLWVNDELSYDQFHEKAGRIFRVTQRLDNGGEITHQTQSAAILAETIEDICPEVEMATRVRGFKRGTVVTVGDKKFNETKHGMADEKFFSVFSFDLLKGDPSKVLTEPRTAVLSESAAHKYFGDVDPIGMTFTMYEDDFMVTGLYKDMPFNSHFHFDVLFSIASYPGTPGQEWWWNNYKTYVVLREGADTKLLEEKLTDIVKRYMYKSEEKYLENVESGHYTTMPIQKITDIHLKSHLLWEFEANGDESYVQFLSFIALFILIIAIVNYVNLSTANATGRAKEIGIRKSVGSTRTSLIRQFITESILMSMLAFIVAVAFVYLLMPLFRNVVGKAWLSIPLFDDPTLPGLLIVFSLVIGLIAGIYPSLVLSSYEPIEVIRGKSSRGSHKSVLRNSLVVFQFAMSIILLVGTFVVREQMNYTQNKNLGFDKEQVLVINTLGEMGEKIGVFKEELKKDPSVLSISTSTSVPGKSFNNLGSGLESTKRGQATNIYGVDDEFKDVFKIELLKGRFFSRKIASDSQAVVLNESMANLWGVEEIDGSRMNISIKGFSPFNIIGIIKDFHYESFHEKIRPLEMVMIPGLASWSESYISVRLDTRNTLASIKTIEETWSSLLPGIPFDYTFMDDIYSEQYNNEKRTGNVFSVFTFLALFVACLGLVGLTSFTLEQRTKEIGVRKVLGASVQGLVAKLSGEFTKWVIVANLISWPLAYFIMDSWLSNFAYRIEIEWWMFVVAGFGALLISLITVSLQSIKAARKNPVNSLKYE